MENNLSPNLTIREVQTLKYLIFINKVSDGHKRALEILEDMGLGK